MKLHAPRSQPPAYAELQAVSNFSFLEGGSHPDELVAQAKALGLAALGIADRNTVAGVVRAHAAAKQVGLRFLPGARLDLECGMRLICYPTDRAAWGRLCRLLSFGQMRAPKGDCHLDLEDVAAHAEGMVLIVLPPEDWDWREALDQGSCPDEAKTSGSFPSLSRDRAIAYGESPSPSRGGVRGGGTIQSAEVAGSPHPRPLPIKGRGEEADAKCDCPAQGGIRACLGIDPGGGEGAAERSCEATTTANIIHFDEAQSRLRREWGQPHTPLGGHLPDPPSFVAEASHRNSASSPLPMGDQPRTMPHPAPPSKKRGGSGETSPERGMGRQPHSGRRPDDQSLETNLHRIKSLLPSSARLYLATSHTYRGNDRARLNALAAIATRLAIPLLATGDVLYHAPHRRPLQDVLTAIRNHTTVAEAGLRLARNAERHLKSPQETARLFAGHEAAVARTHEVVEACRFSLDELVYEYPDEPVPPGITPQAHLEALAREGARHRYPDGVPENVAVTLERELALIRELRYAPYFLTVHDIVSYARSQSILAQGRGSAANSVVCYCLGITAVNPTEVDLLFERFVSPERKEPPDIDVDFEHERREEVIQYIYDRYGRDRAGLAATVISYRSRSAVREVGKAMGLSEDTVSALAGMVWGSHSDGFLPEKHVREAGLDPRDPLLARVVELAGELTGFPRHLSQHVGGFVLTRGPLVEVVPVGNAAMEKRTFIEWDKDDLAALGLLKVDVLALGMLTCIRKAFDLVAAHEGLELTLATVPREDPAVYEMLCKADSLGVFQVESRAQMNMLPRLKPRCFYDLVIEVAIVRPGPIQGDMVHPYLRRRDRLEPVQYPSPAPEHGDKDELERILGKTLGVPLFQEQAMRIAMSAARFTDAEVNELRKAMATFRRRGTIGALEAKMVEAMVARGYERAFAVRCFNQIKGFGEYGFPESHAASFAHLVYVSSWLKCHHPAAFAAALLNSQPMGFYAPAQIVRDAIEHGVEVREPDVGHSDWDCTLEPGGRDGRPAVRLGLKQIDGLVEDEGKRIVETRSRLRREWGQLHTPPREHLPDPQLFATEADHETSTSSSSPLGAELSHLARPPPPCGEGLGVGGRTRARRSRFHPTPSPSRGGEKKPRSYAIALPLAGRGELQSSALHPEAPSKKGGGSGETSPERGTGRQPRSGRRTEPDRAAAFTDVHDLWQRAGVRLATLERLAAADAMRSLGLDRRQALWAVKGLANAAPLPLFAWGETRESGPEPSVSLPAMPLSEHVVSDYQTLRLSLKAHPMSFLRAGLTARRIAACADLRNLKDGARVAVAGVVLVRQRPGSAKGVVFMTIEDETGIANVVVWPKTLERYRREIMSARLILIRGRIQRHADIIHVVSAVVEDRSDLLATLTEDNARPMPVPIANADEVLRPEPGSWRSSAQPRETGHARRHPRDQRIIPRSRDFH